MDAFWTFVTERPWSSAVGVVAVALAVLWARSRLRPTGAVGASFDEKRQNRGIGPLQVFKGLPFVAGLVGLPLIYLAPTIFGAATPDEEIAAREAMIKCVGGALAIFGLALAAYRSEQNDRDVRVRESQDRTGRYVKCVELLGAMRPVTRPRMDGPRVWRLPENDWEPNIEARIGAIEALAQLANEPRRENDGMARRVRDTLAAYIRLQRPRGPRTEDLPPLPAAPSGHERPSTEERDVQQDGGGSSVDSPPEKSFTQDQLAALRAFGRVEWDGCEPKADLSEVDIRGVDWRRAKLAGTKLEGSDLSNGRLQEAELTECEAKEATLAKCDFRGARLRGADFENAIFRESNLAGAVFDSTTNLKGADFDGSGFFDESLGKTEFDFGLTVEQVLKAENWQSATFSPSFREALDRAAAAAQAASAAVN